MDLKFKDNNKLKLVPFTKLEYIESTGTQYIDTGVKNSSNIIADIEYSFTEYIGDAIFGSDDGNYDNNTFESSASSQYNFGYAFGNAYKLGEPPIIGTKYRLHLANGLQYVSTGGTRITESIFTMSFEGNNNIYLFGINRAGSFIVPAKAKIFEFKVYNNNNVLILDLVPAKYRNVVCMYDIVSQTFFYNQGTGNFIAGPEVPSTISVLPETISIKTTSLYHKNTPNVNGLQLLNNILNYQKTHQDEIKEYYYPTTQLWQDIISEYPDIVQYYDMNHKLCIPICESDDPEQCAEDFLDAASDIQQELEDYPDSIPIIAKYPALAHFIVENPSLASIILENPEVVHSLVDTGYETWLQADGSSWIVTNYYINGNTDVECRACILNYNNNQNASPMLYGGALSYQGVGGEMYGWYDFNFNYYSNSVEFTTSEVPINVKFKAETTAGLINISLDNGNTLTRGSTSRLTFTSSVPTVVFALNRGSVDFKSATSKLSSLKFKEGAVDKLWLVPIQNNGNPCMIDLLTGTKYLNQGTGSFTYSLESKNA